MYVFCVGCCMPFSPPVAHVSPCGSSAYGYVFIHTSRCHMRETEYVCTLSVWVLCWMLCECICMSRIRVCFVLNAMWMHMYVHCLCVCCVECYVNAYVCTVSVCVLCWLLCECVCMYIVCVCVVLNATSMWMHTYVLYSDFHNDCLFFSKKKTISILNAENKDRSDAFWLRNLNLSFFIEKKKGSHYGNQSICVCFVLIAMCPALPQRYPLLSCECDIYIYMCVYIYIFICLPWYILFIFFWTWFIVICSCIPVWRITDTYFRAKWLEAP
jgi:hypothetical protein